MARIVAGRVKVLGDLELKAKLARMGGVSKAGLDIVIVHGAETIRDEAQGRVAVASGALRSGIKSSTKGRIVSASSRAGGAAREYAPYVEHGTVKMAARPFLLPSVPAGKARMDSELAALGGAIVRA